jgi:ADP-glucose pyrophosphorylase
VRQYSWLFRDIKNRNVEEIVILSGDHLYRMDYMKVRQGAYRLHCLDCQCRPG